MKKSTSLIVFASLLIFNVFTSRVSAQTAANEIKTLRDLFAARDYAEGYRLGKEFAVKNPDDLELQYWYAANGARSPESKTTLEDVEKLIKSKGENLWTLMALAAAQTTRQSADAMLTAEKIIKLAPIVEEAVFVYNSTLFQNKKYAASLEWLNQNDNRVKDRARFLTAKAVSLYFVEKDKKEKGQIQAAFDLFAQALKLDPQSVNANFLYGNYLTREKRFEEAIPFLRKAAELSPRVANLRESYWSAVESQTKKTAEQKNAELEAAMNSYLEQSKNSPDALLNIWKKYVDLTGWNDTADLKYRQKRERLKETIVKKYPNTKYDEELAFIETTRLYGKYFAKTDGTKYLEIRNKPESKRTAEEAKFLDDYDAKSKLYSAERLRAERAFLQRSPRFEKQRFGQISFNVFQSIAADKESKDEELSVLIADALENYKSDWENINSQIAVQLLRRRENLPDSAIAKDAERYARAGVAAADEKIKLLPKDALPVQIKDVAFRPTVNLAETLIKNEKFEEAEKLLTAVSKMLEAVDAQNLDIEFEKSDAKMAWANFYAAKKDWDRAEDFYFGIYKDNEYGKTAFAKLYEQKFGKKEGFDAYYADVQKKLRIRAKERIAESRIKNPQDAVAFSLKDLNDRIVSFSDLKGKVIVINVWGTWCGPCVAEMSELQEFYDKYKNDQEVAVLTLDSGDELAVVKKFMTERKLTLPVLMDDGYLDKTPQFSKTGAFPTTFFIDKSGKVAFVKTGNSGNLVEEFSSRVDILKAN